MNRSRTTLATFAAAVLLISGLEAVPAMATDTPKPAAPPTIDACTPEPPDYFFTNVAISTRPTNLYSAYITGPGTITYNQNTTATASMSATATVTSEASVVIAKASVALGVTLGASFSSSGGFSYALPVPSGQRRRMRLFQQSRSFVVSKKIFTPSTCKWTTQYADPTNAPKKARDDEWRLEA
jgi:Flp pilus assembly protein TadG